MVSASQKAHGKLLALEVAKLWAVLEFGLRIAVGLLGPAVVVFFLGSPRFLFEIAGSKSLDFR